MTHTDGQYTHNAMTTPPLLLLSPIIPCSGNLTTVKRIRYHFEKNGFPCILRSPDDFLDSSALQEYIANEGIRLVLAIHAYKSGKILQNVSVPYIIIMGGTDVNESSKEPDKLSVIHTCVNNSRYIVAFTQQLADAFFHVCPHIDKNRLAIIPQAVSVCPSDVNIKRDHILHLLSSREYSDGATNHAVYINNININDVQHRDLEGIKLFTFIGGIRPVKNPLYIARKFSEWHIKQKRMNCFLLIIGTNLDENYFKVFMEEITGLPGVIYIPGLCEADVHAAIRDSDALINTSDSEGMSIAILEAMALSTPVLVRAIPGNVAIVTDGINGLVFHDEQEFFTKAEQILTDRKEVVRITQNALQYIQDHHCLLLEELSYTSLVRKVETIS